MPPPWPEHGAASRISNLHDVGRILPAPPGDPTPSILDYDYEAEEEEEGRWVNDNDAGR